MVKKGETRKKERTSVSSQSDIRLEKVLIENFVSLQHVMTNLAQKFENLSSQISKLLELFEISAKALAERGGFEEEREEDKRAAEKLDSLLEQSKIIAKGVALLHEKNSSSSEPQYPPLQSMRPMQPQQQTQGPFSGFSKNPRIGK